MNPLVSTLIKGMLYFILKAKQGGKYLSRKQVIDKRTGRKTWKYKYKPMQQRAAHEVTRGKFEKVTKLSGDEHKSQIEHALRNGIHVSLHVLRDYPDLAVKYHQQARLAKADKIRAKVKASKVKNEVKVDDTKGMTTNESLNPLPEGIENLAKIYLNDEFKYKVFTGYIPSKDRFNRVSNLQNFKSMVNFFSKKTPSVEGLTTPKLDKIRFYLDNVQSGDAKSFMGADFKGDSTLGAIQGNFRNQTVSILPDVRQNIARRLQNKELQEMALLTKDMDAIRSTGGLSYDEDRQNDYMRLMIRMKLTGHEIPDSINPAKKIYELYPEVKSFQAPPVSDNREVENKPLTEKIGEHSITLDRNPQNKLYGKGKKFSVSVVSSSKGYDPLSGFGNIFSYNKDFDNYDEAVKYYSEIKEKVKKEGVQSGYTTKEKDVSYYANFYKDSSIPRIKENIEEIKSVEGYQEKYKNKLEALTKILKDREVENNFNTMHENKPEPAVPSNKGIQLDEKHFDEKGQSEWIQDRRFYQKAVNNVAKNFSNATFRLDEVSPYGAKVIVTIDGKDQELTKSKVARADFKRLFGKSLEEMQTVESKPEPAKSPDLKANFESWKEERKTAAPAFKLEQEDITSKEKNTRYMDAQGGLFGKKPTTHESYAKKDFKPSLALEGNETITSLVTAVKSALMREGLDTKAREFVDKAFREKDINSLKKLASEYVKLQSVDDVY